MTDGQEIQHLIEAEDTNDITEFSDYGSCPGSETQSLNSSIHGFMEQHGRRYHTYYGEDKNLMPNDAVEQDRLDAVHEGIRLFTGKLCQAPVLGNTAIQRVLDLGTGTGIWAINFADANPHAEVVGMDLSPIQPRFVPPNCRFVTDDFERDWMYTFPFDFIHARTIGQSVADWPRLLKQAYDNLAPGGYLEVNDIAFMPACDDGTMPYDWPPCVLFRLMREALEKSGKIPPPTTGQLQQMMTEAGFTAVKHETFKNPSGTWPKDPTMKQAGAFTVHSANSGYEAYGLALLTRVLKMSEDEVIAMCRKATDAHLDKRVHAYWPYNSVYARKPLGA